MLESLYFRLVGVLFNVTFEKLANTRVMSTKKKKKNLILMLVFL